MGNVYYTGSLTPNSGSAVDPNEIPAGTVFEGKFSELPVFFESLEGKYCNGTITYKITEDEELSSNRILIPEESPLRIVIDGYNDRESRNCIIKDSGQVEWGSLCSVGYKSNQQLLSQSNVITFKNISFEGQGRTFSVHRMGLTFFNVRCFINIVYCDFTGFSGAALILETESRVNYCTFTDNTSPLASQNTGWVCVTNSSFSNCTNAISTFRGSLVQSTDNTFSNVTNRYNTTNTSATTGALFIYTP